jgi:hypothetical protein
MRYEITGKFRVLLNDEFSSIKRFRYWARKIVVGIVTRCGLDVPGIESRWRARFSAPVRIGPGAHPTFCVMGAGSLPRG